MSIGFKIVNDEFILLSTELIAMLYLLIENVKVWYCIVTLSACDLLMHHISAIDYGSSWLLLQILLKHITYMLPGLKSRINSQLVAVAKEHAAYGDTAESTVITFSAHNCKIVTCPSSTNYENYTSSHKRVMFMTFQSKQNAISITKFYCCVFEKY